MIVPKCSTSKAKWFLYNLLLIESRFPSLRETHNTHYFYRKIILAPHLVNGVSEVNKVLKVQEKK